MATSTTKKAAAKSTAAKPTTADSAPADGTAVTAAPATANGDAQAKADAAASESAPTGLTHTYADREYNSEALAAEARKAEFSATGPVAKTEEGKASAEIGGDVVAAAVPADTSKQDKPAAVGGLIDKAKWVDADGYPIGDHIGGTAPQDVAAQIIENQRTHGDTPVGVGVAPVERTPNAVRLAEFAPREGLVGDDAPVSRPESTTPAYVEDNSRLVDQKGKSVSIADVFAEGEGRNPFRVTTKRVYVERPMPGTDKTTRVLLLAAGTRVPHSKVAELTRQWSPASQG